MGIPLPSDTSAAGLERNEIAAARDSCAGPLADGPLHDPGCEPAGENSPV